MTFEKVINVTGRLIKKRKNENDLILLIHYKCQKYNLSPIVKYEDCELMDTNNYISNQYKSNCIIKTYPSQTGIISTRILFK